LAFGLKRFPTAGAGLALRPETDTDRNESRKRTKQELHRHKVWGATDGCVQDARTVVHTHFHLKLLTKTPTKTQEEVELETRKDEMESVKRKSEGNGRSGPSRRTTQTRFTRSAKATPHWVRTLGGLLEVLVVAQLGLSAGISARLAVADHVDGLLELGLERHIADNGVE
jgi:hypothetical protein